VSNITVAETCNRIGRGIYTHRVSHLSITAIISISKTVSEKAKIRPAWPNRLQVGIVATSGKVSAKDVFSTAPIMMRSDLGSKAGSKPCPLIETYAGTGTGPTVETGRQANADLRWALGKARSGTRYCANLGESLTARFRPLNGHSK
jgi:hypothetical protein